MTQHPRAKNYYVSDYDKNGLPEETHMKQYMKVFRRRQEQTIMDGLWDKFKDAWVKYHKHHTPQSEEDLKKCCDKYHQWQQRVISK